MKNSLGSDRRLTRPLMAALVAALLVWTFIRISEEMLEGDTGAFDMAILQVAQSLRRSHPWVAEVARDLSGVGSVTVLTLLTLVTVGYLAVVKSRPAALLVAAAVITGSLGVSLLKNRIARPRPDVAFAALVAPA